VRHLLGETGLRVLQRKPAFQSATQFSARAGSLALRDRFDSPTSERLRAPDPDAYPHRRTPPPSTREAGSQSCVPRPGADGSADDTDWGRKCPGRLPVCRGRVGERMVHISCGADLGPSVGTRGRHRESHQPWGIKVEVGPRGGPHLLGTHAGEPRARPPSSSRSLQPEARYVEDPRPAGKRGRADSGRDAPGPGEEGEADPHPASCRPRGDGAGWMPRTEDAAAGTCRGRELPFEVPRRPATREQGVMNRMEMLPQERGVEEADDRA
jgi:hypothetical protein